MRNGNINNKKKEEKSKKNVIIVIIRIISILVILICLGLIVYRYLNLRDSSKVIEDINSNIEINDKNIELDGVATSLIDTDVSSLKKINQDTVAYLKVNGTNINYPVVQSNDNEYYLRHSFDKSYSQAGWIFLDYRNNIERLDNNNIIYGHNMLNQTMFSNLTKMLNKSFFNDSNNLYINLTTECKKTIWKIFSVYVTNPDTYYMTIGFSSPSAHQDFLNTIKNRSIYTFDEQVTVTDKILTLSTCTNLNTKRLVVHAKLIYSENK